DRLLAAFGVCALAGAGPDRFHHRQSVSLRCVGTGSWLPHRQLHRAGGVAAVNFIPLSARRAQALRAEHFCRQFGGTPAEKSAEPMKTVSFALALVAAVAV